MRFATLLFLTALVPAQINSEQIDELVAHAMKKFEVAGVAVAVVKDGAVHHCKGYGVRSIEAPGPVDRHTNFAIASNTKAFTSAALAILIDEGKLRWNDKVVKHIPEFEMYAPYVTANFTVEDLLTHRSGLGLGAGDLMFFPDGTDFTIDDILKCFRHFKPVSAFRTKYDYDNLLYKVAGEVVKRVSGMRWEDFVRTRILEPLGMERSRTGMVDQDDLPNVATPHSTETGTMRTIPHFRIDSRRVNGAAGAIFSNVDDLTRWVLCQLNGGRYGDGLKERLFSRQRQREMWTIHTTIPTRGDARYRTHFRGYGLGWGLSDVRGNMSVSHTGGLPGMLSKTLLIPDLDLGIVVLTNTANGGAGLFRAVTQTILDRFLKLDDFGWVEKLHARYLAQQRSGDAVSAKVWKAVEESKSVPVDADTWVGVYQDPWFGKIEVTRKDGALWMRCHRSPKLHGRMHFYKANTFAVRWEYRDMNADAFAIFSLDENGRADRIKMKGISPNIDFSFDFEDLDLRRVAPR